MSSAISSLPITTLYDNSPSFTYRGHTDEFYISKSFLLNRVDVIKDQMFVLLSLSPDYRGGTFDKEVTFSSVLPLDQSLSIRKTSYYILPSTSTIFAPIPELAQDFDCQLIPTEQHLIDSREGYLLALKDASIIAAITDTTADIFASMGLK